MKKNLFSTFGSLRAAGIALLASALLLLSPLAQAQRAFATPEAAAEALVDALATNDPQALQQVLGANEHELVKRGVIREDIYTFLAAWARKHEIVPVNEREAAVAVGDSGWTLPVPLVRGAKGWRFDPAAGAIEMRRRAIGRNELAAMDTLRALSEAQTKYAQGVGQGRYASRLVSRPGTQDGLYWPAVDGAAEQAFGPDALVMGPQVPVDEAYVGYRFQILPGADGKTYQIVAWPARYGQTGKSTFIITSDGRLQEADFGPSTASRVSALRAADLNAAFWQDARVGTAAK